MADDFPAARTSRGFHRAHLFPVDGDSAIAELWHNGEVWADIRLEGVRLDAHGEDRLTSATAVVRFYPRPPGAAPDWPEYGLDEVLAALTAAHQWLRENERGRVPVQGDDALSAAGRAMSTASASTIERLIASVPPASNPEPPDAGSGELAVVLVAGGDTPIELIRELRRLTGWGLMDARALLEGRPSVVMRGLSATDAAEVRRSLEAARATVEFR